MNIKKIADLAYNAINLKDNDTPYLKNKKLIKQIFKLNIKEKIILRLTVLDSFYSTNMNKRYFGIEELAEELKKFNNDKRLIQTAKRFLKDPKNSKEMGFIGLFEKEYGQNKNRNGGQKAISLISKYLYFLTDYKFPIYDNLVRWGIGSPSEKNAVKFYEKMVNLNKNSSINNFDKLDSFLWVFGKIYKNNNYSGIWTKKEWKTGKTSNKDLIRFEKQIEMAEIRKHLKKLTEE